MAKKYDPIKRREQYLKNREKEKEQAKDRYQKNRPKRVQQMKDYFNENREAHNERMRKRRKKIKATL